LSTSCRAWMILWLREMIFFLVLGEAISFTALALLCSLTSLRILNVLLALSPSDVILVQILSIYALNTAFLYTYLEWKNFFFQRNFLEAELHLSPLCCSRDKSLWLIHSPALPFLRRKSFLPALDYETSNSSSRLEGLGLILHQRFLIQFVYIVDGAKIKFAWKLKPWKEYLEYLRINLFSLWMKYEW